MFGTDQPVITTRAWSSPRILQIDSDLNTGIHLKDSALKVHFQKAKTTESRESGARAVFVDPDVRDNEFRIAAAIRVNKESVGVHAEDEMHRDIGFDVNYSRKVDRSPKCLDLKISAASEGGFHARIKSRHSARLIEADIAGNSIQPIELFAELIQCLDGGANVIK